MCLLSKDFNSTALIIVFFFRKKSSTHLCKHYCWLEKNNRTMKMFVHLLVVPYCCVCVVLSPIFSFLFQLLCARDKEKYNIFLIQSENPGIC